MTTETAKPANVWPYVGIYIATTIILTAIWVMVGYLAPALVELAPTLVEKAKTAASFVTIFASTLSAYSIFIRRNGRLFDRGEYWRVVLLSTAATLLFSAIMMLFSITVRTAPGSVNDVPARIWIILLIIGAIFGLCVNAIGFSSRFGKTLLKAHSKRQTQLDTEPFR
ncbi:ABZJ_00895 family protein [Mesorhizobium sp. VK9D]|uniref:ABZJ_00895 family protein n=1 Tax=Mesorhizobium australafricanum TaxID=3072311 RepID=UPI002A2485E3|nr:ABZJ_00895 family protein [Mesorhizobium sp. VK9D]MDX8454361.1 ABZJ_00895 family protein [Mesorhizobium sp. VK9D]